MSDDLDKAMASIGPENKIDGLSMDLEKTNREKLQSIFPDCFSEGKLDIDKLLGLCGEYITADFEKYAFTWKGKSECLQLAQQRSVATLRPCPEESVDFETTKNLYIEGDNLEVIKLLQAGYYRKVKMIYIDPPYNTGNDFVYHDDFSDTLARYKEVTSQTTKSHPETMGRFHTDWLNMMYPRLRLAANLLRDDGVIFISIDDNEVHNLRKLCDETFGEENFVAQIVWKKRSTPPNDKVIGAAHEYVLLYARRITEMKINLRPRGEKQLEQYKNPDNHPKGPWTAGDLMANVKGGRYVQSLYFPIINPDTGEEHYPSSNGNWRFNKEKIEELIASNEIYFGEDGRGRPKLKRFLSEVKDGMTYTTIWDFVPFNARGSAEMTEILGNLTIFDNPKPSGLILELCRLGSSDSDIILDFFSGSATTAHAVMALNAEDGGNRQFIMVQLPELCDEKSEAFKAGYKNICEIGKERIRRAGKKLTETPRQLQLGEETKTFDVGFKVFKLDSSNNRTWDPTPIPRDNLDLLIGRLDTMIERRKPDRTDLDLVYEVMLKLGIPLTESVTEIDFDGKTAYRVREDGLIMVCLTEDVPIKMVEKMADFLPVQIVFGQKCFADVVAMSNAKLLLRNIDADIDIKFI